MERKIITPEALAGFRGYLEREERREATVSNYLYGVGLLAEFLGGREVSAQAVREFRDCLTARGFAPGSVNTVLSAVNAFFRSRGWTGCGVKLLKTQKRTFCPEAKVLEKCEYERLIRAAGPRDRLLVLTLGSTGIRVSELQYFTVEAVKNGEVTVTGKAKSRQIFLQKKLRRELLGFAQRVGITSGPIFLSKTGGPLPRGSVWAILKRLAKKAEVAVSKVFPHNLRKLFARAFYAVSRDIAKLADLLGHSSIDTTRIYIMTTGAEHRKVLEKMKLLI